MKVAASMSVGRLAPKHTLNIDGIRKLSKNVNPQLIKDNVVLRDNLHGRTIEEYSNDTFQPVIDAYNGKQRRKDRQIRTNYCEWHRSKVIINDSVTREAISREQMRKFLTFIKEDEYYKKYYDGIYVLFHTGLRISEFVGLTVKDLDMENKTIRVDHQLQRKSDGTKYITSTKTNAGTRVLPMEEEVYACFQRILANRKAPKQEPVIDGYSGFLFFDKDDRPMVSMHWEHYFKHILNKYNSIYKEELPNITPHVCRHTYCSNKAKSGMNPKTLQYLMGHSEISVTMDTYTHLGLQDAWEELQRLQLQFSQNELGLRVVKTA